MPRPIRNPYPFANSIGRKISQVRQAQGLSNVKFAKLAGVSRRHLIEMQKGGSTSLLVAFKAMKALRLRQLEHEFEGELLTLAIADSQGSIHSGMLVETAEQLEEVAGRLQQTALAIREALTGAARTAASSSPRAAAASDSARARAAAVIEDFGNIFRNADAEGKVELLQQLHAASGSSGPAEEEAPAPEAKTRRKSKTAV